MIEGNVNTSTIKRLSLHKIAFSEVFVQGRKYLLLMWHGGMLDGIHYSSIGNSSCKSLPMTTYLGRTSLPSVLKVVVEFYCNKNITLFYPSPRAH